MLVGFNGGVYWAVHFSSVQKHFWLMFSLWVAKPFVYIVIHELGNPVLDKPV